jgi:hypothetical protein
VGKPERKRPLETPRCRWKNNIQLGLREIGWEYGLESTGWGQRPVEGSCEHSNKPLGSIKC